MAGNTLHQIGKMRPLARADIIFVHGLDGDWDKTWRSSDADDEGSWPEWLAEDNPSLNVWSLSYDSSSTAWFGKGMDILTAATSVLDRLGQTEIGRRTIVFVVHSLGGLVVKQILRTANDANNPEWKQILNATQGVAFLATPHSGAGLASFIVKIGEVLGVFGLFFRRQKTIDNLKTNNPQLADLSSWYRDQVDRLEIANIVYQEDVGVSGVVVVDQTAANPGIKDVRPVGIARNHIDICKPPSRQDQVYQGVSRFIESCISRQPLNRKGHETTSVSSEESDAHLEKGISKSDRPSKVKTVEDSSVLTNTPMRITSFGAKKCVEIFLSGDPAAAVEVIPELSQCSLDVYDRLLQVVPSNSHLDLLLQDLTQTIGSPALPALTKALVEGSWDTKRTVAPCFYAFRDDSTAHGQLYKILAENTDFDVRRLTIEAIGYAAYGPAYVSIINLALYDDMDRERHEIYDYSFGKLYAYAVFALAQIFGKSGDRTYLSRLEDFSNTCIERGKDCSNEIYAASKYMNAGAADSIQSEWLTHQNPKFREFGLGILERQRIQRALPSLLRVATDIHETPQNRTSADICLANLSSNRAAQAVFELIDQGSNSSSLSWSFSALFAQPVCYSPPAEVIESLLGRRDEPNQQLLLALAWRGHMECEEEILSGLDSSVSFVRGSSAAAHAIMNGNAAIDRLTSGHEEASDEFEKALFAAAMVHAGDERAIELLHQSLQNLPLLKEVRPIWNQYILTAFVKCERGSNREKVWSRIMHENIATTRSRYDAQVAFFR